MSRNLPTWFWGWSAALLAAAALPYLLAWALTPNGYQFTGMLVNPQDGYSYVAKIRLAAEGGWSGWSGWSGWLPYAIHAYGDAPIYPQYVLLGKVSAVTGAPPVLVYHGARVAAAAFLLAMTLLLLNQLIKSEEARKTAFIFAAVGGGLTWLTVPFGALGSDVTIPESTTFGGSFANPHFPMATGLLFLVAAVALRGPLSSPRLAFTGLLANLAAIAMQPFLWVTQVAVGGVWAALMIGKGRTTPSAVLARWLSAALLLAPSALLLLLMARALYGDPVLAQWSTQNVTLSPPPATYLIGYGALLPPALAGLWTLWRTPHEAGCTPRAGLFVIAWAVAGCALLYAPAPFQRRLSEGLQLPIAVLAAAGIHGTLLAALGEAWRRRTRLLVTAIGCASIFWLTYTSVAGALLLRDGFYLSDDDAAALTWLADNALRDDLLLAAPVIGNVAPVYGPARVYWGHPYETPTAALREAAVHRFYQPETATAERCRILTEGNVTLVYAGPNEARLGGARLDDQALGLASVYQNQSVTIYQRASAC